MTENESFSLYVPFKIKLIETAGAVLFPLAEDHEQNVVIKKTQILY